MNKLNLIFTINSKLKTVRLKKEMMTSSLVKNTYLQLNFT